MNYGNFTPSIVEINSLGIGLLSTSNINRLDLTSDEFLVVGEQYSTSNTTVDKKYSLIVNRDGVAINSSRSRFNAMTNTGIKNSGLYVDNNIVCDGNIIAKGLKLAEVTLSGEINSNMLNDLILKINDVNQHFYTGYGALKNDQNQNYQIIEVDNIYTPAYITIGGIIDTYDNSHPLNISASANNNINNTHISIRNNIDNDIEPTKFRLGIIGNAATSPAVINTTDGMPLEFHIGKSTDNINNLYKDDGNTGYPNYSQYNNLLPAMVINADNTVSIGSTSNQKINYTKYTKQSINIITSSNIDTYSKLDVKGALSSSDIVMYDYYTCNYMHLDDIYVRSQGLTFKANQIKEGDFIKGVFRFNSNLYIGSNNDQYILEVNNTLNVTDTLNVANVANIENINILNNAFFEKDTTFNNDVHINNDVILGRNITINDGDLFIANERINVINAFPIMISENVVNQYDLSGSNILFFASSNTLNFSSGSNLVVPGRLGVGLNADDEYNEQLNVIKHNPNKFELLLQDSSRNGTATHTPMVYMGHLNNLNNVNNIADNSFIINTNTLDTLHNIYFYTGVDIDRNNQNNLIPAMSVYQNNKVGINIVSPTHTLHVNGEILCNDIFINVNNKPQKTLLFINKDDGTRDTARDFYYLYDTSGVKSFCINFADNTNIDIKGLNVKGGIHSVDGGFYDNNTKIETFKFTNTDYKACYTNTNILIGWDKRYGNNNTTTKPLNIRNINNVDYNDSIIRFYKGTVYGGERNSARFSGIDICEDPNKVLPNTSNINLYKWFMYKNHYNEDPNTNAIGPLQFGYTDGTQHPTHYGMTMYYNKNNSKYSIDINNPTINNSLNVLNNRKSAMNVYGDLDVYGNINIVDTNHSNFNFKINGVTASTTALQEEIRRLNNSSNATSLYPENLNDIIITGKKISMFPQSSMIVGHIDNSFVNYINNTGNDINQNTPLIVYQNNDYTPISKFYVADIENTNIFTNKASIELGIFNTLDNNYSGIKKNTIEFAVSTFNNTNKINNTRFDICSFNGAYNNKLISFFTNGTSSYINIGNNSVCHNQNTGVLNVGNIEDVSLHIENSSKYLLQLTNNAKTPAINLHKQSGNLNDFWIIEAPDANGNFNIKNGSSSNSYIPQTSNNVLILTSSKQLGFNNDTPVYGVDIALINDKHSARFLNKYDDNYLTENYSAINIVNSNLRYTKTTSNITNNVINSGLTYYMDSSYYPSKDIYGEDIIYDVLVNSNLVKTTSSNITNTWNISKQYIIPVTSNNTLLQHTYNNSTYNTIADNVGNFTMTFNNSNTILPQIPSSTNDITYNIINHSNNITTHSALLQTIPSQFTSVSIKSLRFNYNTSNDTVYSSHSIYNNNDFTLTSNITSVLDNYSNVTGNLYDFNIFNTIDTFITSNNTTINTNDYDSYFINTYFNSITNIPSGIYKFNFNIHTSNIIYYNKAHNYNIDVDTTIIRHYDYNSIINTPSTIFNTNASNIYNYNITDNNVDIDSSNVFLNIAPYGIYSGDGYLTSSNILINNYIYKDTFQLFDKDYEFNLNIKDNYYTYLPDTKNFYLITNNIQYEPHIILQNNINFGDDKKYGMINKIYSKNGSINFVAEAEQYKNNQLTLKNNGDVEVEHSIYTNKIYTYDGIYDGLGNSLIFNYTADLYNQAFVLQSSNYILYTSNYDIKSTSNITFTLQGDYKEGVKIIKEHYTNENNTPSSYDLLKIYEGSNIALSVINGGKMGIKKDNPLYELDVEGDIFGSNIIARNFYGDGSYLTTVNLSDRSTSLLEEGSNLYYTTERVGIICEASNILTSNYVLQTSNIISDILTISSNIISDRLTITSNYIITTSNIISNQLINTSNDITNILSNTSNDISTRLTNTSNDITIILSNTSNDINNTIFPAISALNIKTDDIISTYSTTTNISEGTNKYFTETYFDRTLINRNLNFLNNGTSNRFISENNVNVFLDTTEIYLGAIHVKSLLVDNITATTINTTTISSDTSIQQTTQEAVATNILINGNTSLPMFKIEKNNVNNGSNLMELFIIDPTYYGNKDVFFINNKGKVGIGVQPDSILSEIFTVNGNITASQFKGGGDFITNVNLNDKYTTDLAEGTNLYYTPLRVANIINASNIFTSNYIVLSSISTSNQLTNNLYATSNIISATIYNNSNQLTNNLYATSNIISSTIYNNSNQLTNNLYANSNIISATIYNNSNQLTNNLYATSNIISSTIYNNSNQLTNNLYATSNKIVFNLDDLYSKYNATSTSIYNVDTRVTNLNTDNINNSTGINNKFIVNNIYNNYLNISNINQTNKQTLAIFQDNTINNDIITVYKNNSNVLVLSKDGKIGLGTTLPASNLDIIGGIAFTTNINNISSNEINYLKNTTTNINTNFTNTSNYIMTTSNLISARISDTSNYITTTSNLISARISDTSNYIMITSNLIGDRLTNTSNYITTTSNLISARISDTSNYITTSSNLISDRLTNTSNYITTTSNLISDRLTNTSNYITTSSNLISDRITNLNTTLSTSYPTFINSGLIISSSNINTSNYILNTSNTISDRITNLNTTLSTSYPTFINSGLITSSSNINTSNYILNTSNTISDRITNLNTTLSTSYPTFINSGLITSSSNINTSNYILNTSNTISDIITNLNTSLSTSYPTFINSGIITSSSNINTSNYIRNTSNIVSDRITNLRWSSNANIIYINNGDYVGIGTNTYNSGNVLDIVNDNYLSIRKADLTAGISINYNSIKVIGTGLTNDITINSKGDTSKINFKIETTNVADINKERFYINGMIITTGDVISAYSDIRLKNIVSTIDDPINIVNNLNGFKYIPNDLALSFGLTNKIDYGISAQDVKNILPEMVSIAPFDRDNNGNSKSGEDYLTVNYEKLVPVLIEAIKELNKKIIVLENKINNPV